jgi:hypothetical protein
LENAFYDRFLSKEYNLDQLEGILEIPLDRQVADKLRKEVKTLRRWDGIKRLTPEISKEFQESAREIANRKSTSRIFLDLEYWRQPRDIGSPV